MILLIVVFTMSASEPVLGPIYLIFLQDKFATNITQLAGAFLPAGLVSLALAETRTIPFLALLFTCSVLLRSAPPPSPQHQGPEACTTMNSEPSLLLDQNLGA